MTENIFDQFIVVDEKAFTDFISEMKEPYCRHHCDLNCAQCTSPTESKTNFVALAHSAASFEFILDNRAELLEIKCIGNDSEPPAVSLAQIIQWQWDGNGKQVIQESKMIKTGEVFRFRISSLCSVVIRILKKREKSAENLCPPISSLPDDKFTVHIGEKKIDLSSHFLMSVSPVINRMLSVEMKEKQQRSLTLDELGVDMEQFIEFVEAVSTTAIHKPILPNPQNVLFLLKLADYFQVDWLKKRCEAHLINCPEIPLMDRFLLIDHFRLDNLKIYFLNLAVDKLRAFYKANRDQLSPGQSAVSDQLLGELVTRLCG